MPAAVAAFFPWLGPVLQAFLLGGVGTMANLSLHVLAAFLSMLVYLGLHSILSSGEREQDLPHPLLLITSLLIVSQVYGPIGLVFAAPAAGVAQAILGTLVSLRISSEAADVDGNRSLCSPPKYWRMDCRTPN